MSILQPGMALITGEAYEALKHPEIMAGLSDAGKDRLRREIDFFNAKWGTRFWNRKPWAMFMIWDDQITLMGVDKKRTILGVDHYLRSSRTWL